MPERTRCEQPGCASAAKSTLHSSPALSSSLVSSPPASKNRHPLLALQKQIGNQAVTQWVQATLKVGAANDEYEREAERIAEQVTHGQALHGPTIQRQHTCTCGGECPECKAKQQSQINTSLQTRRIRGGGAGMLFAPPLVHEVLRSPGRPLDSATRAFMESRFGHDFGQVRIHAGAQAATSAQSMGAVAYTVGHHVVFGEGHYVPDTFAGQRLLAHELTHVIQQKGSGASTLIQRESESALDENALRIIALAQDSNRPVEDRAVAVVRAIIDQYYPADSSKVSSIRYRQGEQGLRVTYTGRGEATTGIITVGRYFVRQTDRSGFARRIAQVRHEIEHIEQIRAGMAGAHRSDEREFIAFYHEALFEELPHTGRISHSTRVALIDAALGYYYCLNEELQRNNTTRRDELLARRATAARRSGRAAELPAAPTTCRRQDSDAPPAGAASTSVPARRAGLELRGGISLPEGERTAAFALGGRISLRSNQAVIFNPLLGAQLLYLPAVGDRSTHLAAALGEIGLRIQQPTRGVYFDVRTGGYVGVELPGAAVEAGLTGELGFGYRWERLELGVAARGLLDLASDRNRVLILGAGAIRF